MDYDSGAALAQAMQQMNTRDWSPGSSVEELSPAVEVDRLRTVDVDTGKKLQAALKSMPSGPAPVQSAAGTRYGKKSAAGPGPLQRQMERAAAERAKEMDGETGMSYLHWQTRPEPPQAAQAASPAQSPAAQPVAQQPMRIVSKPAQQLQREAPRVVAGAASPVPTGQAQGQEKVQAVGAARPALQKADSGANGSAPMVYRQVQPQQVRRMPSRVLIQVKNVNVNCCDSSGKVCVCMCVCVCARALSCACVCQCDLL